MSRIGNKPIDVPEKVQVNVSDEGQVNVEGPRGKLQWVLPRQIQARKENNRIALQRSSDARSVKALHGLSRSLIANMVHGVSAGYAKELEIQGVGFRAAVQGKNLNLSLGFSHPVLFAIPEGIKITVTENTRVRIEGVDKRLVGQVAADIRGFYPPEPYKGKGIRYAGEQVPRKAGKTVQ
jgi:large subunit ribosomal protein L6